ncbi:MAG TPA: AAC(3) family N-acetyltransferase [Anaerolineaceae bacterium]
MISYRDVINGFKALNIETDRPVIAHASLSSFGEVRGGADTLLGALVTSFAGVMMPAFTYKTMLIPEEGPEENGLRYGSGRDANRMVEFYRPDMPADPLMGVVAEKLRQMPSARRSGHPILSFVGIGVDDALAAQSLDEPLASIGELTRRGGWVLLLGVDNSVNTSIHYGERLAGRKQFLRWAITPQGARACPGFPGCSNGFEQITPAAAGFARTARVGGAQVTAMPLRDLLATVQQVVREDPLALLCGREDCERCVTVRKAVRSAYN